MSSLSLTRRIPPPPGQRYAKKLGSCARSTWQDGRPAVRDPSRIFASESLKYVRDSLVSLHSTYLPHPNTQEYFPASLDSSILPPFRRIVRTLKDRGATVLPVSLPNTSHALSAYYVIASAEASSNLARYDGVQYGLHFPLPADAIARSPGEVYAHSRTAGFGAEAKRRILLGTYALMAEYALTHSSSLGT